MQQERCQPGRGAKFTAHLGALQAPRAGSGGENSAAWFVEPRGEPEFPSRQAARPLGSSRIDGRRPAAGGGRAGRGRERDAAPGPPLNATTLTGVFRGHCARRPCRPLARSPPLVFELLALWPVSGAAATLAVYNTVKSVRGRNSLMSALNCVALEV